MNPSCFRKSSFEDFVIYLKKEFENIYRCVLEEAQTMCQLNAEFLWDWNADRIQAELIEFQKVTITVRELEQKHSWHIT